MRGLKHGPFAHARVFTVNSSLEAKTATVDRNILYFFPLIPFLGPQIARFGLRSPLTA